MKNRYIHSEIPELAGDLLDQGPVRLGPAPIADPRRPLQVALCAMQLAQRLGMDCSAPLLSEAPLLSAVVNKKMFYLRGWRAFDGCIKGFNTLGLMAEQILDECDRYHAMPLARQNLTKLEFLRSRLGSGGAVFSEGDLDNIRPEELLLISDYDIALWNLFSKRTIVCSTSSNMGLSTHQALRLMQNAKLVFRGRSFPLLNANEGSLLIWCPDERADFMNEEKTRFLRALEKDLPQMTQLKTYINRQQRDPGALKDALLAGGYFFPTNPQSREEMQHLIFVALSDLARERAVTVEKILEDPNVREALEHCGCQVGHDGVKVLKGIESGIHGLMIPYFILLDQFLCTGDQRAICAWNQASIGAALAGAVMADQYLRIADRWDDSLRGEFNSAFPSISRFLDTRRFGKDLKTRIHGVFDIANLQSLAQRLGVVVEDHLSGRGTAYVGLGSSSYSNGNRCVDILRENMRESGAFQGKNALHPATHTLNAFAQALIYGEALYQAVVHDGANIREVRKPEPAGAAALVGYLLVRLDKKTLSLLEIAYALRLMGFSQELFLRFAGFVSGEQGIRTFLQAAFEEGPGMEQLAQDLLVLLSWPLTRIEEKMRFEKRSSRARYWQDPVDDLEIEYLGGATAIYLTGDTTLQPSDDLARQLADGCCQNQPSAKKWLEESSKNLPSGQIKDPADLAYLWFYRAARKAAYFGGHVESVGKRWVHEHFSKSENHPRD